MAYLIMAYLTGGVKNYVHFTSAKPDELINKRWPHQCVIYQQGTEQTKINELMI